MAKLDNVTGYGEIGEILSMISPKSWAEATTEKLFYVKHKSALPESVTRYPFKYHDLFTSQFKVTLIVSFISLASISVNIYFYDQFIGIWRRNVPSCYALSPL